MKFGKIAAAALITTITSGTVAPFAAYGDGADGEKRFFESQYRHDVMEHFNYSMKKLIPILFKKAGHEDHLPAIANIMANTAKMTKSAFEKDTRSMEGHTAAKDGIWDSWDDFAARMDKLEADTAAFAEAAKSGDMAVIMPAFKKVGSNCKSCHDEYKDS